jgi:hypothetical protein
VLARLYRSRQAVEALEKGFLDWPVAGGLVIPLYGYPDLLDNLLDLLDDMGFVVEGMMYDDVDGLNILAARPGVVRNA